ncbi:MAG: S8 family serine peptidase [Oscillospiraceae bacterium]|nr:S8 family serine peptidase [Oscillospiraceae bacterium]
MYTNPVNESYFPGKVIVALRREFTGQAMLAGIDFTNAEVIYRPEHNEEGIAQIVLLHLRNKDEMGVLAAIDRLNAHPDVVFAEPDYVEYPHVVPNDPLFRNLWGMTAIRAPQAWDIATGTTQVIVGVLDSGIESTHPDLRANVATGTGQFDGRDQEGHGTHVAGTIGALGNNHLGVTGVCWRVGLANFKLGNRMFDLATAIAAIDFSRRAGLPILNNSWGSRGYSRALRLAIAQYDGLFVVSAGNNGTNNDTQPMYPASYDSPNIISVASTTQNGSLSGFSNFGVRSVDIAAPGSAIVSTNINNTYSSMNGTSMAAPHVAGVAALVKAHKPSLTTANLKQVLMRSARRVPALNGRVASGGIVDARAALEAANQCDCNCRC